MAFHEKGVTSIHYHPEYPLMASASNDATIQQFQLLASLLHLHHLLLQIYP